MMMNVRVLGSVQFTVVLQERLGDKYNESFDSLDNFEILCWVVSCGHLNLCELAITCTFGQRVV